MYMYVLCMYQNLVVFFSVPSGGSIDAVQSMIMFSARESGQDRMGFGGSCVYMCVCGLADGRMRSLECNVNVM